MSVRNYSTRVNSYIYNPLGHEGYSYKESGDISSNTIDKWIKYGDQHHEQKDFSQAKDYYYRAMINDPQNTTALNSYASCLNNLGYYQQALEVYEIILDLDPKDKTALANKEITNGNITKAEQQQQEQYVDYSNSRSGRDFWAALAVFGNAMMAVGNSYNTSSNSAYFSNGYGSSDNNSSYNSPAQSGSSNNTKFTSQYQAWERRAESAYESLTNSSMSASNYTRRKQLLRESQREMAKIRSNASKEGVSIPKSKWESVSVSSH